MRAAVLKGYCDISIDDVAEPKITNPGELKIKVICGAICNVTDNKLFASHTPENNWPFLKPPFILGHECFGRIVEKGDAAQNFNVGDIVAYWTVDCGAFADYLIIDAKKAAVVSLDAGVPNEVAAIMEMVIGACRLLYLPDGEALIKPGDDVAVFGLGPAGLIYIRLAKMLNAGRVFGVGRRKFRLDKALGMGVDFVVDAGEPDYRGLIHKKLDKKPDVIIDATGGDIMPDIIEFGAENTRIIPYGVAPFSWNEKLDLLSSRRIAPPAFTGLDSARIAAVKCAEWAKSGRLGVEKVVSHKLPLDQVSRGLDMCRLERDTTSKVVISINE